LCPALLEMHPVDGIRTFVGQCSHPDSRWLGRGPTKAWTRPKRVKFALAAPVERIGAPAKVEPQRNRPKPEIAAHRIEQIAPVAFGKLLGPVAEHDERRGSRRHLRDVAELDALALGGG